MSVIRITVQPTPTTTHCDATVVLEGRPYKFSFYMDAETDGWAFDVSNDDGSAVVRGIALANGVDLLDPYRYADFPPGYLAIQDQGLNGADPDMEAFADGRAQLLYLESA